MHQSASARLQGRFFLFLAAAMLVLGGCASSLGPVNDSLQKRQYAWAGAIRWGDFEGAFGLVEPGVREQHPLTELELERYAQLQVSSYREIASTADLKGGFAARDIEIGIINRHTMAERTAQYREEWRYDAEAKQWWLTSGMPDFWKGQ
ncbi:hypothetical protein [Marilutibacter aestuarii]|uniref:Uncharacterized protein n=1 Tax=Marilutibacter aestuarii TaxID=1706195 RepID=A0A508AAB1_9GAMM|nr:hypothetical protein [Lysobacter aestuarii]TQD45471.1 hypothetical protein FKV25_08010 [Lysobacter aestuarii]